MNFTYNELAVVLVLTFLVGVAATLCLAAVLAHMGDTQNSNDTNYLS